MDVFLPDTLSEWLQTFLAFAGVLAIVMAVVKWIVHVTIGRQIDDLGKKLLEHMDEESSLQFSVNEKLRDYDSKMDDMRIKLERIDSQVEGLVMWLIGGAPESRGQ